ncbi:MAG: ferritin family protein [bacterium]
MGTFSVNDIVESAVQIEKNGTAFYKKVSEIAGTPELERFFMALAHEEIKHQEIFENILNGLKPQVLHETYEGEYDIYLDALVKEHVFTREDEIALSECAVDVHRNNKALGYAIAFEKDTILFFHEMKKYLRGKNEEIIMQLIEEEKKHIIRLREKKED